jgi:hypothetical protein
MDTRRHSPLTVALTIVELIANNRGAGSTTLQMKGAENYDRPFLIVSQTRSHSQTLSTISGNPNAKIASIGESSKTRGQKLAILFDNHLIFNALTGMIGLFNAEFARTSALVESVYDATIAIEKMSELSDIYQKQAHTLEDLSLELVHCKWWEFKKVSRIKEAIRAQWRSNRKDSDVILSLLNELGEIHERNKSQIKKVKDGYN